MVLENQAQQTAQELNEERRLLVIRPDWSRIVQEVIAVDLDVKWWRGETRLRQEDLGFEEVEPEYRDFLSKNIILGRKRLMPAQYHRELRGLEGKARDILNRYSYLSGWGHLMPKKAYPEWKQLILPIRDRFYEVRDELVALRNLVSQVRTLNFTSDEEVERCIQAIEQVAVSARAGERDVAEITRTLRQVGVITRGELLSLGRTPRSARAMEIPDRIDEATVCRARRELLRPEQTEVLTLPLRQVRRKTEREEIGANL